jgi:hypothetical protein
VAAAATASGFTALTWHTPETSGFYQPVLTARAAAGPGIVPGHRDGGRPR